MTKWKILGRTDGGTGWYVVASPLTFDTARTELGRFRKEALSGDYFVIADAAQIPLMQYLPVRKVA